MSKAAAVGRKTVRLANSIVNSAVLFVILLLLVFGCYAIWDSGKVHNDADASVYEIYKPTDENDALSFKELQLINPDVFAWLTIYGTHIDYPVVQGKDNMEYINTDAEGHYSLSGSIFLDSKCSRDFTDFSNIFYGHHMEKQAMFGEIGSFSDQEYFDARRYGVLYYDGRKHGLEFFALVHADAYDKKVFRTRITEATEQQLYLDKLKKTALHIRDDVRVTTADRLVLLTTCSDATTNGRDILIGRITNEIHTDPFKMDETNGSNGLLSLGVLAGLWEKAPLVIKIILAALPFLLILLAVILIKKKMQKTGKERIRTK